MITLQNLDLSESDFKLILDGLEALPHRGLAGEMIEDIILSLAADKPGEKNEQFIRERKKKKEENRRLQESMIEDIKILQGKIIMLKRYLLEQNAINETQDLLNKDAHNDPRI